MRSNMPGEGAAAMSSPEATLKRADDGGKGEGQMVLMAGGEGEWAGRRQNRRAGAGRRCWACS